MSEGEWLAGIDPERMLRGLGRNPSKRKQRLFGCVCCRRIWHLIPDERSRAAVVVAERFADGLASGVELDVSRAEAKTAFEQQNRGRPPWVGRWAAAACYCVAMKNSGDAVH